MHTAVVVLGLAGVAAACPDLATLRSDRVKHGLDAAKLAGEWYEVLAADITQVGAKCQRFNNSAPDAAGTYAQSFSTYYGPLPFHQTYMYESQGVPGVYTSYLKGAKALLTLPSVIVDVVPDANGAYSMFTSYKCKSVAGVVDVSEFRVSARAAAVPDAVLTAAKQAAIDAGLKASFVGGAKTISQAGCKN
eukprot:TRINITY_DN5639_c0_g1_i2.p3 TRINITY_DN5639_c0_g1~~TRINITY_DN5639_c0_g1_i2.p3  ORF type:complete len:191 (+),score=53.06 TRINITY_DN5639_c0_g1_i2:65-637(+)